MNTMKNSLVTLYKRLQLPPYYNRSTITNPFLMESFAKPQWRYMKGDQQYNMTPFIYFNPTKHEYGYWGELQTIESHANYFMKPYSIIAYGSNYTDTKLDSLMVRGWLHEAPNHHLHILIMMEKMNHNDLYIGQMRNYYSIINNPFWYPSPEFFAKKNDTTNNNDDKLLQEVRLDKQTYTINTTI